MLQKVFYYIKNVDDPKKIFWETNHNKLYSYDRENQKFYFNSKKEGKQELQLFSKQISFDQNLVDTLTKLIDPAISIASQFSEESVDVNHDTKERIIGLITSTTTITSYEQISIFEYTGKIFIRCLMNHSLANGNKRFSLAYLSLILSSFGYHLYWTRGSKTNYKKYENLISNFVVELENKNNLNLKNNSKYKDAENKIFKWIKNNVVVSIP